MGREKRHPTAEALIDRMGSLCESYGLSRIAGRMLGYFIVYGGARSLDELVEHLGVSKASVSTNARVLERIGVLEGVSRPGERRDFYRLGDNPWENMLELAQRRMQSLVEAFETTLSGLPPELGEARDRIQGWAAFYDFVLRDLNEKVSQWRASSSAQD